MQLVVNIENLANKVNNKCPATMLAIRRTDSVTGRIIILTVSIKTIKDIRANGVPIGVRWDKKFLALLFSASITLIIHNKKVIGRLRDMCDVDDMIKGNKE